MAEEPGSRLELYKLAVEMADRTTGRRAGTNTFFFTLHASLAVVVGVVSAARRAPSDKPTLTFDKFGLSLTAAAGFVLAVAWWMLIRYYRRLNGAKFDVINEIEKSLPVQIYTDEWRILHPEEPVPTGVEGGSHGVVKERPWFTEKKHREATVVEQVIPLVFAAIYIALEVRVLLA